MSDQGRKNPKLLSPSELKGRKSRAGRSRGMWVNLVIMVLVLGAAVFAYFGTQMLKTTEPEATMPPSTAVKLVDHQQADLKSFTVQVRDAQPYTVLQVNPGEVAPTAQPTEVPATEVPATEAPAVTAAPTAAATVAPAVAAPEATAEVVAANAAAAGATATAVPSAAIASVPTETPAVTATAEPAATAASTVTSAPTPTATPVATVAPTAAATPAATAEAVAADAAVTAEPTALAEVTATPKPTATPDPTYAIDGSPEFLIDLSKVKAMAGYCASLSASKVVVENAEDLSAYGLADPAIRVTMNYRDGSSEEWLFGDKVPTSSSYYFAKAGTKTVYLVYSSPYGAFNRKLTELHTAIMPVTIESANVRDLLIEQQGKETVELKYVDEGDSKLSISTIKLVQPFVYDAQSERTTEMTDAIAALTIKGYAGELKDLPDAGLVEPLIKIHVEDSNEQVLNFRVGKYADDATVYVQVDDTNAVYLCDATLLSFVSNAKASYLVDQFSNLVNITKVTAIDVKAGADSYSMSVDRQPALKADGTAETDANGNPKTNDTYYFDGKTTDTDLFKDLYQVIIGLMGSKLSDDRNIQGDVVATVTYTLNVDPGTFTVEYLTYDSEYYAVRRDGMTLFLIKQSQVTNMLDQLAKYRAGTFTKTD